MGRRGHVRLWSTHWEGGKWVKVQEEKKARARLSCRAIRRTDYGPTRQTTVMEPGRERT